MKKMFGVKFIALAAALLTVGGAYAAAPAAMQISNDTGYFTSAYVHNAAGQPIGPHGFATIPWATVTGLCHGTASHQLKDADPCAFEVYVSNDPSNPQQIDLATVTFYVSDGDVVNVSYVDRVAGLKISSSRPGQFDLKGRSAT